MALPNFNSRLFQVLAALLTCAALSPAADPPVSRTLTAAQAQEDVAIMRRALEAVHPGLYRRTPKTSIDQAFTRLEASAASPVSDLALYRSMSAMLAEIRCNHTKAEQPAALEKWRQTNPSHFPFRFLILEGKMIVVSSYPAQPGLVKGDEIVAIDGRPAAELINTLGALVPIDGDTIWARATNLASDGDLMGADFDHFYPFVYGFPKSLTLQVRSQGSRAQRTVKDLRPITFKAWTQLPFPDSGYRADFDKTTRWYQADPQTAVLEIRTFVNYRNPVVPKAFYDRIFTEINASGAQHLVLDLRQNGGGSSDATYTLMDYLAERPYVWNRALRLKAVRYGDLPRYVSTWGDPKETFEPPMEQFTQASDGWFEILPHYQPDELMPRLPSPLRFKGTVTVLTSPVNGSGSTMLISKLKDEGRVRLVGQPSGGSGDGPTAGNIFLVKLPNSGIGIRVPNAFNQMQVARFDAKGGITPDVIVTPTVADFIAGRDLTLETALKQAEKPHTGPVRDTVAASKLFSGKWTGTLTYRDYQSSKRVVLPTKLTVTPNPASGEMSFSYVFDDGPGKIVKSVVHVGIDAAQGIFSMRDDDEPEPDVYRFTGPVAAAAPLQLSMWGRGTENDQAVELHETLGLKDGVFTLLRETRRKGEAFLFRHEYRFTPERP